MKRHKKRLSVKCVHCKSSESGLRSSHQSRPTSLNPNVLRTRTQGALIESQESKIDHKINLPHNCSLRIKYTIMMKQVKCLYAFQKKGESKKMSTKVSD